MNYTTRLELYYHVFHTFCPKYRIIYTLAEIPLFANYCDYAVIMFSCTELILKSDNVHCCVLILSSVGPTTMPCQLMVGFFAYANSLEIHVDKKELEGITNHHESNVFLDSLILSCIK
jgi:hypothetical protein